VDWGKNEMKNEMEELNSGSMKDSGAHVLSRGWIDKFRRRLHFNLQNVRVEGRHSRANHTSRQTCTLSGNAKSTSETRTEKFKKRETLSVEREAGVHRKLTEYDLDALLGARRPLVTTAPVSLSVSSVLFMLRIDVG
jgi:hypothetical protein